MPGYDERELHAKYSCCTSQIDRLYSEIGDQMIFV